MSTDARLNTRRRQLVTAAGAIALGAPALVRAQAAPRSASATGRWRPGLPFFAAIEKGYFKEAGLDVEPLKFAGAQQVMEAMLVGPLRRQLQRHRLGNLGDRRDRAAGALQDLRTNPSNAKYVLDEFLVPKDSPVKTIAELKGKRVASAPASRT
jgi:NitT/TauT family transport system substrate-binding protein